VTTPNIIKREEGTAPGYYEFRYALQKSLENSIGIIKEVHDEYAKKFGRSYGNGLFKTYKTEDADTIIFAMGSVSAQVRTVIGKLRAEGLKIGLVTLRLFRPFPVRYLREFFKDKKNIVVFDRAIGYGYEGVLCYELKAALYGVHPSPFIKGFIVGLGGRDVKGEHIINGVHRALELSKKGEIDYETEFYGLKLDELDFLD
jgi:pyruvate ferredoxin oxidoreductase alpha subunit